MHGPISSGYNKDEKYGRIVEPDTKFSNLTSEFKELPFEYSKDGKYLAVSDNVKTVSIHDLVDGKIVTKIEGIRATALSFSPLGTYFVAWTKYNKETGPNMFVYETISGKVVAKIIEKSFTRAKWPFLKWSSDEKIASRRVTNQIQFFKGSPLNTEEIISSLHVPGVASFVLSPVSKPLKIATFVPERKGSSATVSVYLFPEDTKKQKPLNSRSFFKAQEGDLKFSPSGKFLICHTSTDIDRSGGSYYGAMFGYLLSCRSKGVQDTCALPEPCQAVEWSPTDDEFVAITGKVSTASAAIYNSKGKKMHDFGKAARNTISWAPHGRFFLIAGFGSLQGTMDFYDHETMKKIGHTSAGSPPTSWQWSPDSRCLLLATLFPRMRQGVGFEMYNYRGDILFREDCEELTQVAWQYSSGVKYPNHPPSPGKIRAKDISVRKQAKKTKAISTGGKYVPPGRRNRSVETMKKYVPPGARRTGIPGMSSSSSTIPGMSGDQQKKKSNKKRSKKKPRSDDNDATTKKDEKTSVDPPAAPVVDKAKEMRKIQKKLREIERLKSKSELNESQKKKISMEAQFLKKLEELKLS